VVLLIGDCEATTGRGEAREAFWTKFTMALVSVPKISSLFSYCPRLAQLVEHGAYDAAAMGSNPIVSIHSKSEINTSTRRVGNTTCDSTHYNALFENLELSNIMFWASCIIL
jgi:hypothetical protein